MPEKSNRRRSEVSSGVTFNHAMVYVRALAPALHFYVDLLGFKVIEQFPWPNSPVYARLRSARGQSTIALHLVEPGRVLPETDGVRLYFEVAQLDKLCRKLEAAGVKFLERPKTMPWGWKHAYLKDPDGHELSLYWAGVRRFQSSSTYSG